MKRSHQRICRVILLLLIFLLRLRRLGTELSGETLLCPRSCTERCPGQPDGERILSVANLRVSPRYADRSFVYRISEAGYETDFYNQFLTATDVMVGEEVRRGLGASQFFKYVVGSSNQLQPNYVLEGSINALYGDFRNLNAPTAVVGKSNFSCTTKMPPIRALPCKSAI